MANLFQAWDEDIQALGAAKASDDQIEARRQQLAEHFKAKAKAAGLSSKKIYETLDQFDAYSRQNTTAQDDQLTPEEQEMAQRVKDGTVGAGAMKEVGKRFKDVGLGVVSSLTRMGGDVAQTWADVGDNDKSELSSQIAQGLYNATDDIRSNYSEGTKQAKKDFWSPAGLTMGVSENLGQIAGTAALLGTGGAAAGALGVASKAGKLATMAGMAAPLAYSQGYGQGKESSLDEINKTSNAQLWENVKAEAKAYDDAGGTGEVPYLVGMFKEAGGDLNLMKDLMAENAGNRSGIMTVATEPLAMGVGSVMSRGAAAGGTGVMAKFANAMNNQGMSNELARRIAAGASAAEARKAGQIVGTTALRDNAAIASQAGKIAATQMAREGVQETAQEGLEGYYAKGEGSRAAGRKGELNSADWSGENGIVQQGLQGGAIGALMGGGGAYSSITSASKLALEKNGLPEKHDAAIIAKEQADAALVQAANIADANPENIDAQKAYAEAQDAALVATNDLEQLTGKFNALYTPEEQAVIKAATMEGIAARKKVADDAAKAQKELDDAQAKEQADIAAQQAEAIKTQRDAVVNNLAGMVGDDVALSNAVADLGLSEEEANSLLDDAHKVAKKQKKEAAKQPAPATATPKTPLEAAVDEAFNADGTRNPKAMTSDIAKKHNIPLKPLVDAIGERIAQNEKTNQQKSDEIAFAERQAEIARQSAKKASQAQKAQKDAEKSDVLSDKQQLENTLADFAANNDHDSMVNFLRDYEPTEADKLIKNAYASVENKKKAEQDAIAATKKAEAVKVKESEAKTQAEQKKIAFNQDMADLHTTNPDATMADLNVIGKKHGVKSPIELAKAWVKAKNEAKAAKEAAPKLALPSPETATKDERDITVPTGLNINRDNIENQDRRPIIVRNDGKPFPTQAQAEKALEVKSKKPRKKKEKPITKDTHEVIPVDGGFAIAPVVEVDDKKREAQIRSEINAAVEFYPDVLHKYAVENGLRESNDYSIMTSDMKKQIIDAVVKNELSKQNKKPDDNEDGGVIADAPKPNAPVSPTGEQVVDVAPTKPVEDDGIKTKNIKQPKPADKTVYPHRDDLLTAIAKMKGLNKAQAIYHGIKDSLELNKRGRGLLGVFKEDGRGFDVIARELSDMGYPVNEGGNTPYDNINGTPTPDALLDALRKALFGEDVGTEEYILNKYAAQREADQKEAEEMERLFNGKGSSSWDEADALDNVSDAIVNDITNVISTVAPEKLSETLKEVSNEPIIETSGQTPNAKTEARSPQNGDAETTGNGKTGQQESQSSTGQDSGIGLNPSFNLNAQTNEELAKRDAENKAAEAKRQAEEKAAKDKTQADKEVSDFRLSGSNAPADIAMAGGQKDMFAPPTRGEREAENAQTERKQAQVPQEEVIEHVTAKGKTLRGVVRNIPLAEAKAIDKFTFRKNGGYFIREEHLAKAEPVKAENKQEQLQGKVIAKKGIVVSNEYGGDGWRIISDVKDTDEMVTVIQNENMLSERKLTMNMQSFKERLGQDAEFRKQYQQPQDKSVQNNAPTKQPETKTETRGKIDFSSLTTESAVVDAWMSIKKGDIITTIVGGQLIAQTDFKNNPNMRFHRANGSEVASNIGAISGRPSAHIELAAKLKEQSKNELVKKLIGKTPEGNDLYEDGRGVRFTDNGRGVQVGEDVAITMQNGKTVYDVSGRTDEHRTVEEVAARQPKPKKLQYGDEGYTSDMANQDLSELYLQKEKNGMVEDDRLNQRIKNLEKIFYELRANEPLGRKTSEEKPTPKEPSKNTIFTEDAAEKARAILRKKLGGNQLNSGIDPEILQAGLTLAGYHIESGARSFAAFAKAIVDDMGDMVKPYLKSWYMGVKYDPRAANFDGMSSAAEVDSADIEKMVADTKEKPTTAKETLTDLFYKHLKQGTLPENNVNLRKMVAEFDGKEVDNYRLKEAQEMLEAAIARHSRDVVASNHNGDASTFNQLVDAYNKQPNLNIRTSTSIENQAYSTPAPLAFVAAKMANIGKNTTVYEPTAGNGMLLITALPENATVNEMESTRFNNLKDQGFNAHQGDALKAIENGVVKPNSQDAIITNPPFGSIKENGKTVKVAVDGYKIGKIDHLIAVEALKAMNPNGTAAIIIGADMVQGGISTDDRIFFNWLYANYNVVGHFEVDGKLYSRQGASWPVRVIIVHGKQASDKNSPVTGAIPRYDNWKDVYDQYIKMVVASNNRGLSSDTSGTNNAANDTRASQNVDGVETTQTGARGRNTTGNNDDVDGASTRNVSNRSRNGGKQLPVSDNVQRFDERTNAQDNLAVGDNRDTGVTTGNDSRVDGRSKPDGNTGKDVAVLSDADNSFQVKYTPASSRKDEGVLIPINMRQPLMDSLLTLEDNVGDIDEYAAKELGYRNTEQLHDALMGLQVDSVASAIYQIKEKNKGIIIADQTGIGKGRQAAAIIRWAMLNGHTPVFVTVKPQLFTDMYGDLSDIGSNDVKPFIVNTGESISGKDGKKLHKTKPDAKHRKEVEDIAGDGVLPDDYNAVFITYSQINKTNNQQRLLSALSGNAIFILDESHNAGGASSTGMFMQEVLKEAKGVVYLSATFAKRPDNMPLYFKTDMGLAVGDTNELSTAVMQGGLPLQTVISNALVKAGQLFRRERSYNGVSIETKVDSANKVEHEKLSDEATKALRAIVAADRMFHNTYFSQLEKAVEEQGMQARAAGNKAEKSVNHHEFSSVVHNFIRQMLLGLKVDTAANDAIAALKRGEKPLIALENTMGSFLNEYVSANGLKEGDSLGDFGYRDVLSRALHRTRAVTIKDKKGEETRQEVGLHELDSATRAAYDEAQKIIDSLDVTIPASPIDWMRSRIEKAGYTVAEITGRNTSVDYSTETPTVSQVPLSEQNDKVGTTRMFNSGELDAIILNVAGSTGISLHASEKFKDQRIRHMIVAQPAQDINIFMQMLGRIHRTGQVVLPKYTILSLDLPTEKRPTAVLNKKMKSLNANTSSNTESATSIVSMDMLNKYGDKVVAAYLSENQDIAKKIGMEVHGDASSAETNDDFAKKATGRFALLPIQEQNKIYEEIEPQYAALISYLDETGQNELEPKTIDFEAELKLESTAVPATDPSTPFGQEAIYGEYKVKPQGKPMTLDEVKALITKNIGEDVLPSQHTQNLITDGQNGFNSFIATLEKKYQEAKDDEEAGNIQKNIANQKAVFENTKSFIESHRVGSIWQIDIKGDIYNAVITNVKSTFKKGGHGNPFAQSKILISLAVNGELRSITVPLTEFSRIEVSKYYGTAQDALKQRGDDSALAKIITGNLLAAYANIQGSDGRVISFTKKDGSVEQGILLPKKFNFKDNVRQDFAIKDANDVFKLLKSGVTDILKTGVASRKGDIRIIHNTNTGGITIYTPKAKTTGGKWFLDKKLIGITGDFVSNGNTMMVSVPSSKAVAALSAVINKSPLYVLPSQADATKELLGYNDGQIDLKEKTKTEVPSTDKPKFSRGTGSGLTTTQTRAILVKHFGEKLIKALESSGLLTIMATPPSWAKPDADGAYHNGKSYLFTDNLSAETVVATLAHELSGHKGFQELMTPTAYDSLMRQFNRLVNQGNPIALAAKARAEAAEVVTPTADTKEAIALAEKQTLQRQQDELLPYLLTLQATLNATRSQQSAVTKVIEQVYRAVKAWLYRTLSAHGFDGVASKLLQPKDIALLAERMIREMGNGTNPSNNTKAKGSQLSQLNTPQTQINAVRKKYEGTSQWMKAPNGQPTKLNEMQWLQVRTPSFKAWFGDWENDAKNASKVVDENGEPMVVYHGTNSDFTEFKGKRGFYFSPSPDVANSYAEHGRTRNLAFWKKGGENVIPAFLNIKSPLSIDAKNNKYNYDLVEKAIHKSIASHDGVLVSNIIDDFKRKGDAGTIFSAFDPTQIKSAIGNTGEFNPTNPDIRFSRKAKNPITEGIKSAANDAKNSLPDPIAKSIDNFMAGRRLPSSDMANITAKTELSIYKRTIGTQLNTALQLPDFKKVYDMAQRYLQHVAVDAYAALKVAPNLLGKLESWSDLKKDVKKIWPANFIKQKADRAAVASIIFDETLNNELLSDADILKALTSDQRQIYKEARDAIQVSLENTAKSEMVRKLLAAEAINWQTVESLINQDLPVGQFAQAIRDLVESRIGGFKNELEAILDADPKIKEAFKTGNKNKLIPAQKKELKKAKTLKAQIETTEEALKSLNDVENRLGTLIEQGYAPLMRFGEYTLTVRDLDGKVKSFFMFESKAEQVRATNAIVARYGKTVNLETDMISKEEFKQFAGMTPETVALFAKETGMDKDEAYQHYLKHAIPARSAMTRMIKRKGTEGFSDDIQRVVASFVMSNARMSAKNIYAAQIEKSIQAIESGKSVKDQAYVMKENVFNPKENFAQLRNFLFLWNLGGSIFFGLLNMTQPYMQTLPHLSQYVPIGDATRAILRGSKIAGSAMKNGTAPKGYESEYNRAVREGVVDPQNVFMLSGVERGKTGASNSAWGVITHTMGLIAQVTESFNRKAVFIASLQVAKQKGNVWLKKKGFNSAYDFAKDTVDQTQGVYDKANRSNWANTSVGAPLMVFKQFSINYVEQMVRMWKKEAASGDEGKKAVFLMLALLASLSGVMGLPFIKDILDVSETTAAFLGNPVNIEREARLALGKDLADPLFNGVLNHFVFNNLGMDIQSRTGMPDLLPLSNALNPTLSAQGRVNEFASIAGATGGLIENGYDASQFIARGNVGMAALTLLPRSVTSLIASGKMAATDEVTDSKGNKLFDTTWDEGLVKFIDANPKRMADLSRTKSLEWKDKSIQAYMTTNFKQKIIAAMMDDDQSEVQNLMKKVQEWNTSRPNYPVFINLNTLSKNANKKDQTFDARESIPKGMDWMKNERPEM